jgi:ligand-binding sensor domain-containing protein/putative methionine-R-sulfoxide reductase with GAF domain
MCIHRIITLLFVFIFLIVLHTKAQQSFNYSFRHINQSDGLLHARVNAVVQDGKGFIWILTLNGLQRYDGSRFVNYPFDLNNHAQTANIKDLNLFADKKNNVLWLMYNEIEKLDLQKNKFTLFTPEKILQDSSFKFDEYKDSSGNPWLAGPFGVFRYDTTEQKTFPYYFAAVPLSPNQSHFTFTDTTNGDTWFTDWNGLALFDKGTKQKYTHWYNPIHHPLLQLMDKKKLSGIFKDSRQNIWISTGSSSFYKYNCIDKKLTAYSLAEIEKLFVKNSIQKNVLIIKCFFEDNHHNLWIGTANGGLLQYKAEKDLFTYSINEEKNKQGLHYNYEITCIFQDKEENIWLGTDKGINIFNPYRQYFQSIHHDENNAASLPKNEIMHYIQAANGNILAGTWGGGITVYDSNWNFKKNISFPKPYEYNLVWSFVQHDDGNIWIGCQHGYIHIYNPSNDAIQTIHPTELNNQTIWCMVKDRKGNIWMGLNDGKIAGWDKQQHKFYPYNNSAKGISQTFTQAVNIFFDSRQRCWVSTPDGFKEFDTEKRMYAAVYIPDKKNAHSISSGSCEGLEEFNDTTLLVGTVHGGLNFFNPDKKTFSNLTVADGLPANTIHAIKKDDAGFFWFTTDYGLYKFKPADKKFIRMNIEPGTVNAPFNYAPFYKLQDGRWLTATAAEMICFRPQNNDDKKNTDSKVKITGFKVFDRNLFIDSILDISKPVQLSYKENFLTVEFALLNFSNLQQTNYYYQLDGVDKGWVNAGTKVFASYTNLEPGKYVFTVKAEDSGSSGTTNSFTIIITPPFWKTWWFISIIAFSILLLSFLFIRGREKSFKAVAAAKLKVQQLNAEQYKNKLELEQIVNYFSSSLIDKNKTDDVLWDVAKNLIGRLGFVDCMIYLWNDDKTKMIQKAGFGPKGSVEEINKQYFDVLPGQGVVGHVIQTMEPVLLPDTSIDNRYRADEMVRLSEMCVPIIYNNELLGVIDSEHPERNFYTQQHLQLLTTIATLIANKIKSLEAEQSLQQKSIEMYSMNEQLSNAKLEALRSQMNPHFIFNCINSIDALIQSNDKYYATVYLNKFAKLIRNILDSSKQDTVTLTKDLDTLKLYIEMEQFRHENKFTAQLKADDDLLQDDDKVPPLIVQPFVENAILHGLRNIEGNDGILTVDIKKVNDKIQYIITDNGIGRVASGKIMQNKESHYGMQMSYDRIKLFNKEETASVQINDLYNNNIPAGTEVIVTLNIV